MKTSKKKILSISVLAAAAIATLAFYKPAYAQTDTTLVVAGYGGVLGATLREVYEPFEKKFNVKIQWIPGGSSAENVARVAVTKTKAKSEFDVVFGDSMTHYSGSSQGLWAPVDESVVTFYKNQAKQAKTDGKDVINFGIFLTGLFYNEKEFEAKGWAAPAKWNDLFRPEFCGRAGILHPNVSYGLHTVIMLGGGDPKKINDGVAKIAANKKCITVLEPTTSKLDEKAQQGDYVIGGHGNIRVIPLIEKGAKIKFRIPDDGALLGMTSLSVVKNTAHPRLAQEFSNWILRPEAQIAIMEKAVLAPTNTTVTVPSKMVSLGVPDAAAINRSVYIPEKVIFDNRRNWIRQIERATEK